MRALVVANYAWFQRVSTLVRLLNLEQQVAQHVLALLSKPSPFCKALDRHQKRRLSHHACSGGFSSFQSRHDHWNRRCIGRTGRGTRLTQLLVQNLSSWRQHARRNAQEQLMQQTFLVSILQSRVGTCNASTGVAARCTLLQQAQLHWTRLQGSVFLMQQQKESGWRRRGLQWLERAEAESS